MRPADSKHQPLPASRAHKPVILYVEDDEDNWDVAALRLAPQFELLRAATSEQACAMLRQHFAEIAAVMMDIELRGSELSGTELAQLFRGESRADEPLPAYARSLPRLTRPIIFVTAHSAQHDVVKLMLDGGEQVINKPVDFAELTTALAQLAR